VTRQRTGYSADPAPVGRYEGMSNMTRLSICSSWAVEVRKSSGYRSLHHLSVASLNHFSQPCLLQSLLPPLQNIEKVFNEGNWVALRLIAPRLIVVLPKPEIIRYGIASTFTPCAFGLFQCGYLLHWMWPKATKSILNPSACAN
jgi:hypothetical protein